MSQHKALTNSEIAARQAAEQSRQFPKDTGTRTYPAMRSVDLLGGRQLVGYDRAAEVRDSNQGVVHSGTWAECIEWARVKGHLPPHMA